MKPLTIKKLQQLQKILKENNLVNQEDITKEHHTHFEGMTIEIGKELLKKKLADPEDNQNSAPTFREFIKNSPSNSIFSGYIIGGNRPDKRITIEAVECTFENNIKDLRLCMDFLLEHKQADELNITPSEDQKTFTVYAWYD